MGGYAKLFETIIHSTIWGEPDNVRLVWITMLAMADKFGVVEASIPGLADAARVKLDQCEEALERLMAPDKYSRTKDFEGRRIEEIDGGWIVLNFEKYRMKKSQEEQREKWRRNKRKQRARAAEEEEMSPDLSPDLSPDVPPCPPLGVDCPPMSTDVLPIADPEADPDPDPDPEADPEEEGIQEGTEPGSVGSGSGSRSARTRACPVRFSASFVSFWEKYPPQRKVGKKAAWKAWERARRAADWPGLEAILASLERSKQSAQWREQNGRFVPNPTTWLNQGRWDDELPREGQGYEELIAELEEEEDDG